MKTHHIIAAAAALGLSSAPALAQEAPQTPAGPAADTPWSGFYVGGGLNLYFVDKDAAASGMPVEFIDQPSPGAFMGRLGYALNEHFAVEAEAGIGAADSEFGLGDVEQGDIGVDAPWGAHAVFTLPLQTGISGGYLLAKGGYASVTLQRELLGQSFEDVEIAGPSFGGGVGLRSGRWDARLEYSFISGEDEATSGVLGMFGAWRF
jgi:hypothetical protein